MRIVRESDTDFYGELDSGLEMHVQREPGEKWAIESVRALVVTQAPIIAPGVLAGGLAKDVSFNPKQWSKLRFDSPKTAFQFLEDELLAGRMKPLKVLSASR